MPPFTFAVLLLYSFISFSLAQTPLLNQREYYIDPSSTIQPETGDISQPYTSLKSAFRKSQEDLLLLGPGNAANISFFCKADQIFIGFDTDTLLLVVNALEIQSLVKITSYEKDSKNSQMTKYANFAFNESSLRLALVVNSTKVIIENINFQFTFKNDFPLPEIIMLEGNNSDFTISNCAFRNSEVTSNDTSKAIIRVKTSNFSLLSTSIASIQLAVPLIDVSTTPTIRCGSNQFRNITLAESLIRSKDISSLNFGSNKIEEVNGQLLSTAYAQSVTLDQNSFINMRGHFPIQLRDIGSVTITENSFIFARKTEEYGQGIIFIIDANNLAIDGLRVEQYRSTTSAISIAVDRMQTAPTDIKLTIKNVKFLQNSLTFNSSETGLALIRMELPLKADILIENALFLENSIRSDSITNEGASTLWIRSRDSNLNLVHCMLENNNAGFGFSTFHADVRTISMLKSSVVANNQDPYLPTNSESASSSPSYNNLDIYAVTISLTDSEFIDNFATLGGGLKLLEIPDFPIPTAITLKDCTFVGNQAEIGGAIFTNITSEESKVITMEDTYFVRNNATQFPDYNPGPLIRIQNNFKNQQGSSRIILKARHNGALAPERYTSGEFIVKDIASWKPIDYTLEFYISSVHEHVPDSRKIYLTSVQVLDSDPAQSKQVTFQGFTDKETFYYFKLPSLVIRAPPNSLNIIMVTMRPYRKTHDEEPDEYSFIFYLQMAKTVTPCQRGEILNPDTNLCEICPSGTYNLGDDTKGCLACPEGGDCSLGGANLQLLPGYWRDRANPFYDEIYKCYNQERCSGGTYSKCEAGYAGLLCGMCDKEKEGGLNYRNLHKDTCKQCQNATWKEITRDLFAFIAPVILLALTTFILTDSKGIAGPGEEGSAKRFRLCALFNLLVNYMQNLFVIDTFGLYLPEYLRNIIYLFAHPSYSVFSYLTCYLKEPLIPNSNVVLIFFAVPLLKILILLPFVKIISRRGLFRSNLTVFIIWLLFLEIYGFIDFLLTISSCKKIGSVAYSTFFPSTMCDSVTLDQLIANTVFPIFVTLILVLMVFAFYVLKGTFKDSGLQKRMKMMALTEGEEFISRGKCDWICFYFEAIGRIIFLILSNMMELEPRVVAAVILYYLVLVFLYKSTKIAFYSGLKAYLFIVDKMLILTTFTAGIALKHMEEGFIRSFCTEMLGNLNTLYIGFIVLLMLQNCFKSMGNLNTMLRIKLAPRSNSSMNRFLRNPQDNIIQEVAEEYEEDTSSQASLQEEKDFLLYED